MMRRLKKFAAILPMVVAASIGPHGAFGRTTAGIVSAANPTRYHSVTPYVTTRLSAGGKGLLAGMARPINPLREESGVTRIGTQAVTHIIVALTATGARRHGEVWLHECGLAPDPTTDIALVAGGPVDGALVATQAVVRLRNRAFCVTAETDVDLTVTVHGYVTDDAVGMAYTDVSDVVIGTTLPLALSGGEIPPTATAVAVMVEGQGATDRPGRLGIASCASPSAPTTDLVDVDPAAYTTVTLPLVRASAGQCLVGSSGWTGRITLLGVYQSTGVSSISMPPNARFVRHLRSRLTTQTPTRVLDTRTDGGPVASKTQRELDLSTVVPLSATAVVLNMTVVSPMASGYLTVFPCDVARPDTSSLNYVTGQTVANSVTVAVGANRRICLYADGGTDLLTDLSGWYASDGTGDGLVPSQPTRVLDTRSASSPTAGSTTRLALADVLAPGATSAVLNVTAVDPTGAGFVTAYPCDQALPNTSSVNYAVGRTVPNYVTVKLAADRSVCLFTSATTHLLADLLGWYEPGSPVGFDEMMPLRAFDSRRDQPGRVGTGGVMWLTFDSEPTAWLLNLTAVSPDAEGYLTAYPCETAPLTTPPNASNLNYAAGQVVPNQVLVSPGATGSVCFFSKAATHLLADLAGSFTAVPSYTPMLVAP